MIRFPNCKINLGLGVLEKLPDGYHRIETAFYPVSLCDILEINESTSGSTILTVSGIQVPGDFRQNLCYRSWQLLHDKFDIPPVEMHLHKIIPTGAGLGGGSSDAAFALTMMNELFALRMNDNDLSATAEKLGMDCPFFILNKPALGSGKGEILSPLSVSLKGMYIAIVKPEISIPTVEAYSGVVPEPGQTSIRELLGYDVEEWKQVLKNDFEASIFRTHPEIGLIKEKLYSLGAVYASMSGSGSAVYGIFRDKPELTPYFDKYFTWSGKAEENLKM